MPIAAAIAAQMAAKIGALSGDFNRNSEIARIATVGTARTITPSVPAIIGKGCGLPPDPVLLRSDATGNSAENQIASGHNSTKMATPPISVAIQYGAGPL